MELMISFILGACAIFVIFLEFFLPGGIMAAFGCVLAMGSVIFAMSVDMKTGLIALGIETVTLALIIYLALKSLKKSRMALEDDQAGFTSCDFDKSLIGKEAIVVKDLRPSGFIEVNGIHYQAVSTGEYLRKDRKVHIIDGEGAHLIVR